MTPIALTVAPALAPQPLCLGTAFPRRPASEVLADAAEAAAAAEVGGEGDAIDVYGRGAWLESFESEVASEFGKESALFFPTGVCAQLAALCVYAGGVGRGAGDLMPRLSRPSFIVQATSHLLLHEEDAARQLLGFTPLVVGAKDRPLSPADVEKELSRLAAVGARPCCILLEVPHRELGCETLRLDELREMRRLAVQYEVPLHAIVPLHADGARLLEVAPHYGLPLPELCRLFDSLYVSFYKGLGGVTGAMLLGSPTVTREAAVWRRRLGGNPFTVAPLQQLAPLLSSTAAEEGGSLRFVPEAPTCCQAHVYLRGDAAALDAARDAVLRERGVRVYSRLRGAAVGPEADECYFELTLGPRHLEVADAVYVGAWRAFFAALAGPQPGGRKGVGDAEPQS
ncbi:hypothetical protein EMIHUDRAFT_203245 [Emiliania huxleyi CCMP1516]|uniref:Aromatic amino acid beta-eliminating lyase/threonine aldolase domain-containing protein n=2 Tax=Emiliania huxleyi TaxID=2903 RepID=A0A0D3K5T6_EMIH1|nr:hypothetical protein EMIHUDRAFT_203245 [Emiliania huxleyi CCMP1516]EOD31121.1 hypothetical protein EMIHUDRAFT_203245 [Emiliania huxleyi CCMP1516]|eukprot:XP_005783550.1 hypothetical protein EMIHUDRAFT_203245 [Emiliania huxleyi CCMP1516]